MSTSDSEATNELLKTISLSLKGIHNSLEHLTAAVEGVAESIEKAHEPEGDLGVHLVSSLKELASALHKRAQQERSSQPQQGQRHQNQNQQQGRRDDRQQQRQHRQDVRTQHSQDDHPGEDLQPGADYEQPDEPLHSMPEEHDEPLKGVQPPTEIKESGETATPRTAPKNSRPRPSRRRRSSSGNGAGKTAGKQ